MIYCPKCGTANRDGSRFCNECGQRLGAFTRVKCPECGAMNPVQHAFCNQCGGRLLPSSAEPPASEATPAIKGLSLPTKSPLSGEEEEPGEEPDETGEKAPAWLRELGSRWSAEGGASATAAVGEGSDDIPDWLKDLRASLPDDQEEELPEENEVPEWLAAMSPPAGSVGPEREAAPSGVDDQGNPGAEEEEVPDWLVEMRGAAGGEGEMPKEPGGDLPEAEEGEMPDWLAELRGAAGAGEPKEIPGADPPGTEQPGGDLPEAEEGEVPDWLAELRDAAGAGEPKEIPGADLPEAEGDEAPDWLAALRDAAGAEEEEPEEALEGEVPDWLAELRPGEAEAAEPPAGQEEEEVPDWLADMRVSAGAEEEEPQEPPEVELPEAEEAEVPDWLAELRPGEAETAEPPAGQEGEEVPDWLAGMRASAEPEWDEPDEAPGVQPPEAEEVPAAELPEAEEGGVPDWLAELDRPAAEEKPAAAGTPMPEEREPIPAARVPSWLEELRPRATAAEEAAAAVQEEAPGEPAAEEGDLPDWLVPAEGGPEETLARAEIPEWLLALKPAELREEGEPEGPAPVIEEPVEETGLLAGLQGTLPVEMIIAQPRAVAEADEAEAPPTMDTPQARLFAEIVGRSPQAAPKEIAQPQRRLLSMLPRWLIYVALIAVVTLPLLSEEPLLTRGFEAAPPVQTLYDAIEDLEEGVPVLVAFDYDPGTQDEMDVLARVLVGHLMDRQALVAAVSLYPAGPPVAQRILDELAAGRPEYAGAYGESYVNLGFLPGQATAVRLLGQSLPVALPQDFQQNLLADLPALDGVTAIGDFALILELAASEQSVRWWVEQAGTPYDVPLAGGVSASVGPLARPYYQTETQQLVGLVSGLPDAAAYQALRSDEGIAEGTLAARLDSLTGGHLVFILVLAIGSVVQLLRGRGGGR